MANETFVLKHIENCVWMCRSTFPWLTGQDKLREFVNNIKDGAEYLFLTDVNLDHDNIYEEFGSDWEEFTRIMSS